MARLPRDFALPSFFPQWKLLALQGPNIAERACQETALSPVFAVVLPYARQLAEKTVIAQTQ